MSLLKKFFQKLSLLIFVLTFVGFNTLPAMATVGPVEPTGPVEVVGVNEKTGPDSNNSTDVTIENDRKININNDADINNNVTQDLNTGKNEIGSNTVAGDVKTGDIKSDTCIVNVANTNLSGESSVGCQTIDAGGKDSITLTPSSNRINFENDLTGPDSQNSNRLDENNNIQIIDTNDADLNNNVAIDANTGLNSLENNTKVGDLTTGNIDLGVSILNLANLQMPNLILAADVWNLMGALTAISFFKMI